MASCAFGYNRHSLYITLFKKSYNIYQKHNKFEYIATLSIRLSTIYIISSIIYFSVPGPFYSVRKSTSTSMVTGRGRVRGTSGVFCWNTLF